MTRQRRVQVIQPAPPSATLATSSSTLQGDRNPGSTTSDCSGTEPAGTITSPADGDTVPHGGTDVTADLECIPAGMSVWHVTESDGYWPHWQHFTGPLSESVVFDSVGFLSEPETGVEFRILLVVADAQADAALVDYTSDEGNYSGPMEPFPLSDDAILDAVPVIRD